MVKFKVKPEHTTGGKDQRLRKRTGTIDNQERYIQEFNRRLETYQNFYVPCLGWKEFTPSYFGVRREINNEGRIIQPEPTVADIIPSMLYSVWENRQLSPCYIQDVKIVDGVMFYREGGSYNA